MDKMEIEQILESEMNEITGGSTGTCVCENGGAGETVIIVDPGDYDPQKPILV